MNEYSFIVEFDEMGENQINKLWEYLSEKNIKFHVLKDEDLKNENQKLKKQLNEKIVLEMKLKDELEGKRKEYQDVYKDVRIEIKSYKNQQKEFIKYLEDEINMCDGFLDTIKNDLEELPYAGRVAGKTYITTKIMKNETSKKIFEEVLSKYKEIIGGDNNEKRFL